MFHLTAQRLALPVAAILGSSLLFLPIHSDEPPPPREIVLRQGLVIPPVGRYGRNPLPVDPIAARFVAGTWVAPKEGDEEKGADGKQHSWAALAAGKDDTFSSPALVGGYAYFAVPSDAERVMILAASGHAMVYVNGEPHVGDVYQTGYVRLPVLLHKGTNHLLFHVVRGSSQGASRRAGCRRPAQRGRCLAARLARRSG